ncbi:MAG: hypothetical protein HYR55_07240 [Acidobacteria bacterium]|nr:hypothetical protein [Acidobacteriota bacterium]MBI3658271.1 hypothetical protein [Acidobacteriota bacterium]
MQVFGNIYLTALLVLDGIALIIAMVIFVKNIIYKQKDYEEFLPWSVRLLIYGIAYPLLPFVGLGVGAYYLTKGNSVQRRFARGSIFVSIVFCYYDAVIFWGIPIR